MPKCGLLGEHLKHSFSPEIHRCFADYGYSLFEVEGEALAAFMTARDFDGINVTIPYKKAVLSYIDELSDVAKRIGSVNTVIKRADGSLYGDNTDYYGFISLLKHENIDVKGKKVLILGSGGASVSVSAAIGALGGSYVIISRTGENNYDNLYRHFDAEVIVNTTPVGMFPENGKRPLDLKDFKNLKSVVDIIYNPLRTALLLQGESLGLKTANGLYMLVAQAARSSELFIGGKIDNGKIEEVYKFLSSKMQNIIFIGMPGSGKTTLAAALGEQLKRPVIDTDALIEEKINTNIPAYFAEHTEKQFREIETQAIAEAAKQSGVIISTGGGCVTVPENYNLLHQNGVVIWVKRDIENLPKDNRPLSEKTNLSDMYKIREPLYQKFADLSVDNNSSVSAAIKKITEELA